MRTIRNLRKRGLALVMALVMCLSLLPTTAMAAETTTGGSVSTSEQNPNGPKIDKTVSWNGNGGYDIRMDAYVTGTVKTETTSTPTDAVLVLDMSGSMKNCIGCGETNTNYHAVMAGDLDDSKTYYVGMYKTKVTNSNGVWKDDYGNSYTPKTGGSGDWNKNQFYAKCSSRIDALRDAVETFINATATSNAAITDVSKQHRISIVKFAGKKTNEVGNDTYRDTWTYNYSQIVTNLTAVTDANKDSLISTVKGISPAGATSVDYGLQHAQTVLKSSGADRAKVVIVFTDGEPNHDSGFDESVAGDAVAAAATLKTGDTKATIFTISVLEGSNPGDTQGKMNRYMNAVSSNYPNATKNDSYYGGFANLGEGGGNKGFYKVASDADGLKKIFDEISDSISTPSIDVGKESVLYDNMSNFFTLPANASAADVKVWKVPAKTFTTTGEGEAKTTTFTFDESVLERAPNMTVVPWAASAESLTENQVMVQVTGTGKVEVKGFDYSSVGENGNCVLPAPTDSQADKATGYKLVVEFPIKPNTANDVDWTKANSDKYNTNNGAGIKVDEENNFRVNDPTDTETGDNHLQAPVKTYQVTYSASGLPESGTLYDVSGHVVTVPTNPSLGNVRFIEGQDYNRVPTGSTTGTGIADAAQAAYPAENTVYYTKDADGNINGAYKFGGWQRGDSTIVGKANVTVNGTWNPETVPNKPTVDELASLIDKVVVDCVNTKASHADVTYKWSDNTTGTNANTVGLLGVNASGEYTVTVTLNAEGYAALYDNGANEHALVTGTQNVDVALKWNSAANNGAGAWERVTAIEENAADATFPVECRFLGYTVIFQPGDHGTLTDPVTSAPAAPYVIFSELANGAEYPTAPASTADAGYTFDGWYQGDQKVDAFPATVTGSATYTAHWKANTDTAYKVEHYQQQADGSYKLADAEELTGTTGKLVSAAAKDYAGYYYDIRNTSNVVRGVVSGDGSLVLKLYYNLSALYYEVQYLDKDTDTEIINPERVIKDANDQHFHVGDEILAYTVATENAKNKLNGYGYMYDSVNPADRLVINADSSKNVIKLYYQKVTCKVNFYSHDNGQPIAAPVTISGLTPDTMYDAKAIETLALSESPFTVNMLKDYTFVEATGAPLTITHATGNVVNLFYTKQPSASYTVYYMEDGTTNQIANSIDETRNVVVGDKIDPNTYTGITISGYTFKEASPAEWVVTAGRNSFILYYTKDTSTSYTVNYYYQGETVPFSSTYEPNAVVGALIPIDETPAGYKQVEVTGPLNVVEGSDNIVNVYYAKRTDLRYTVEYYKDTLEPKNRIAIRPGEGTLGDPIVPSAEDLTKFKPTGAYADGVVIDKQKTIMADEAENVVRVLYLPTGPAEYRYTIVYWQDAVDTGYCLGTEEEASSVPVADVILTNAQLNAKKHLLEAGYWDGVQVGEPNAKNEIHVVYTKTGTMEHTVTYEWGTAPAGAVLPVDRKTYGFGQPYTVDIAYAKDDEMTAYGEEDGQLYLGTWTFSGWKLNGQVVAGEQTMGSDNVVLTGEWTFTKNSTPPSTGPVKVEYFIEYYYEDENGEFVLDEEKTVEKVATLADKDVTVTVVAEEADIAVGNREYFTYVRYGGVSVTSGKVKVPTSESDIVRLKLCYSRDKYGVTYKWASSYPEGVALPQDSGKYYVGQDVGLQYPNLTLRYDEDGVLLGWWEFQGWNSLDLETTSVAMAVGGITLSGTWKYTPCEVEGYDIRVTKEADKTEVEIGDDVTWLITVENVRDDISYTGLSLKEILTGVYKMTPEEVANGDWLTITGEYERSGLAPYDGIAIDEEDAGDVNDTANDTVNDTTNDTTGGDTTSGPSDSDTSAGGIDGAGADNDIQILSVIPFYGPDDDIDPSMFVDGANWMDFDLGPKDIVRFYVTYTVQKGDQDLTNQVVVKRGDETLGGADEDPVKVVEPDPDVSVEKTPGKTSYTVGEDVIWNIVVTNNGKYKVEGLNLTDSLSGNGVVVTHPTLDPDSFAIAPEDSVTFTATLANAPAGTYTNAVVVSKGSDKLHEDTADEVKVSGLFTVTYTDGVYGAAFADQTTGNIVEGTATPAFSGTPTREGYVFIGWSPAVAGTVTGDATYTAQWRLATEPVTPNPSFTVVKTADRTTASVDDVITYTIRVTNNGNVDLTNIVVSDPMMPNGSETIASLPVGDVRTITYRHTVTAAEAGTTLRNTVTVSGTNPNPDQEDPDDKTDTVETPVTPVTPPPVIIPPVTPTPVIPDPVVPLDPGTSIPDEEVPLAGAVGLNDVDHFAYIIGRDEDHVYPLSNITRAEVATIFFRLMTDDYRSASWSTSNDFADVKAGDWYNNAISTCANAGALSGYPDGSFKPNASITRAEFAAIAARFLDKELYTDDGAGDFSDTADHWAAKEIRLAAKAGWIRGDGNTFRPNDPITRAEVMTIVNRMLDRIPDKDHMLPDMKKWIDNPEDAWYYEAVQEATNEHAYERDAETGVIETWTEILTPRDWKAIETEWVANGGKSAPVEDPAQPAEGEGEVETETQSLPDGI